MKRGALKKCDIVVFIMATGCRLLDDEPLFKKSERKALYPIQYPDLMAQYRKAEAVIWTANEIEFSKDKNDWDVLDEETKSVVKTVLAFFSGADSIVNDNLAENFLKKIHILEVKWFYTFQETMENIHNETYSLMIENLISDPVEKDRLLNAFVTMPAVRRLYLWAQHWIEHNEEKELQNPVLKQYGEEGADVDLLEDLSYIWCTAKQIVAFACVEGIMFSGAFAIIYWIKERGILPGLTFSNELISRDEGLHRDFACMLYHRIQHKPPQDQVIDIIKQATEHSKELITSCMGRFNGMNGKDMGAYIEFVADGLSQDLGYDKIYGSKNPFHFMDKTAFNGVTNFFERRVGEYSKAEREDIQTVDDY